MEVSCPISAERINETVVGIIALMIVVIGITCAVTDNYFAMVFLFVDFGTRAFTNGKFSLLKAIALRISGLLSLPPKMTDLAPKKFAAALGFAFCLTINTFYLFSFELVAFALTMVLLVFAILESFFSICVGCYIYKLLQLVKSDR